MSWTKQVTFQGKVKWASLYKPDKYDAWSLVLYPNDESLVRLKDMKLKNTFKKDEDGECIRMKRNVTSKIKGKTVPFSAPWVTDKNGVPVNVAVGNGSDVTVSCDYYAYRPPTGGTELSHALRMTGVRIDNLVPFEPKTDFAPGDRPPEVLEQAPPQPMW